MIPSLEKRAAASILKISNGRSYRNPKVCFVAIRGNKPVLFLKSVRHAADNGEIRQAHDRLVAAGEEIRKTGWKIRAPKPLWCEPVGPVLVAAEEVMEGRPLDAGNEDEVRRVFDLLFERTRACATGPLERKNGGALMRERMDELARLGSPVPAEVAAIVASVPQDLDLPLMSAHGDFTPANILIQPDKTAAVIDWDGYGTVRAPLYDLLTFHERIPKADAGEIARHLPLLGLDAKALPAIRVLYVLATEARKRRHFHPIERDAMDAEFVRNMKSAI